MPRRSHWILLAQIVFAVGAIWFAGAALAREWPAVRDAWGSMSIRTDLLLLSGVVVLVTYAWLIGVWIGVVRAWGSRISIWPAVRIWFVSNLGKYIPGKVWSIAAMSVMSRNAGVSASAAAGSAVFIQVVNVLAGLAVVLALANEVLALPPEAALTISAAVAAVALTPKAVPRIVQWGARRLGREVIVPQLPYWVVATTFGACAVGWILHGLAFQILAHAVLPDAGGASRHYIAVFASSYIAGYLTPWAVGGIGVREGMLVAQMGPFGLASAANASVLAAVSRLWLTVLEILPGLLLYPLKPRNTVSPLDDD